MKTKKANYNDGVCEDLETFSNIRYTPAWYYKKWPGFLNVESYKILAAWDKGVRTEEEWLAEQGVQEEKEVEMEHTLDMVEEIIEGLEEELKNKKRKQSNVYSELGVAQT